MNVLVLGWEYPPAVAGGLGAACEGLTLGLARATADGVPVRVTLAVPAVGSAPRTAAGLPGAVRCSDAGIVRCSDAGIGSEAGLGSEVRAGGAIASRPGGPVVERVEVPLMDGAGASPRSHLSPYGEVAVANAAPPDARRARATAHRSLYGPDLTAALDAYTRGAFLLLGRRRGDFDVIHAHDWMTVPAAMRLRMALGVPVCLHIHSTAFDRAGSASSDGPLRAPAGDLSAAIEGAGVRAADRVIAVSDFTRDVITRGHGVDPSRIAVVHNAAPVAASTAAPADVAPRPRGGPRTVLFVGRLTRQKGAPFFLRAAADVARGRDDVRFVVVGDGEERARLVEEAAALGLGRRVFFTGSIDDAARDALYARADVYVMTSLSEPFGLTPLEALARGAAVVLPRRAGVAEALPSAPAVDPWDCEALAGEIVRLLDDEAARRRAVADGLREASALDWDTSGARLAAVLREASAA